MNWFKNVVFLTIGVAFFTSCEDKDDKKDNTPVKHDVVLHFQPKFNGEVITDWENAAVKDAYNRAVDVITLKMYLSNIRFSEGTASSSFKEAELIDLRPNALTALFDGYSQGKMVAGDYNQIVFNLGLTDDLNAIDPATYANDDPLSAINGMYWDWATKYIFTKTEGRVDNNNDQVPEKSWFVHTGLDELLRKDITLTKTFSVPTDDTIDVYVNLNTLFVFENDTLDLVNNGQSHTMDNMELATSFSDRLANAFE